ncbi:7286_t:CDS:2, partial [Rhizophagus irregularis]
MRNGRGNCLYGFRKQFLLDSKPLLPSSLRKIGAVFAVVAHGAKNLSKAETIASEALRHSPDNHASPAKNYIIVNYRLRGEPYNQAMVFELSDIIYAIIKMIFGNCVIKETSPSQAVLDTGADVSCISKKHIGELGIAYHDKNNSIKTLDATYSTIGKVNLHIGFNGDEKHKSTPSEFIVIGPDWLGPDLILGGLWFRENGATLNICNSKLLLDDNFAILFK